MKITFLGTSHGVPAADRYCSCTMLEVNGAHYFIDAGAPLIDLLLRRHVDLNSVKTIFTTHFHSDHVDGLVSFAGLCSWYFKTTSPRIYVTEQKGMDALARIISMSASRWCICMYSASPVSTLVTTTQYSPPCASNAASSKTSYCVGMV